MSIEIENNFMRQLLLLMKIEDEKNFSMYLTHTFEIENVDELEYLIKVVRNHKLFKIEYILKNEFVDENIVRLLANQHLNRLFSGNLINMTNIFINEILYMLEYYNMDEFNDIILSIIEKSIPVTLMGYREEIEYMSIKKFIDDDIIHKFINKGE